MGYLKFKNAFSLPPLGKSCRENDEPHTASSLARLLDARRNFYTSAFGSERRACHMETLSAALFLGSIG
jgi:hypothetical protein